MGDACPAKELSHNTLTTSVYIFDLPPVATGVPLTPPGDYVRRPTEHDLALDLGTLFMPLDLAMAEAAHAQPTPLRASRVAIGCRPRAARHRRQATLVALLGPLPRGWMAS